MTVPLPDLALQVSGFLDGWEPSVQYFETIGNYTPPPTVSLTKPAGPGDVYLLRLQQERHGSKERLRVSGIYPYGRLEASRNTSYPTGRNARPEDISVAREADAQFIAMHIERRLLADYVQAVDLGIRERDEWEAKHTRCLALAKELAAIGNTCPTPGRLSGRGHYHNSIWSDFQVNQGSEATTVDLKLGSLPPEVAKLVLAVVADHVAKLQAGG